MICVLLTFFKGVDGSLDWIWYLFLSNLYLCWNKIKIFGTFELWDSNPINENDDEISVGKCNRISFSFPLSALKSHYPNGILEVCRLCSATDCHRPWMFWWNWGFCIKWLLEGESDGQTILGKSKWCILNSSLWAHHRPPAKIRDASSGIRILH